ncbi:Cof-type HAD-IIB family hydrolase [Clostridium sp.]|uniref:Cof-type HAD-IIB family hydrolase n=1 Tax=Clostridium sp. TaxID=1506 RepID=UPI003F31812B
MSQIIFFDIDGTLRDEVYGIPATAKDAVRMIKDNGIYVVLCTGRPIGVIQDDVIELEFDGIIASGGAHIEFKNKIIEKSYFKESEIDRASLYFKNTEYKTAFTFETNDNVFMNYEAVKVLNYLNDEKFKILNEEEKKIVKDNEKIIYKDNIKDFNSKEHKVNKICLWTQRYVYEKLKGIFKEDGFQLAQSFEYDDVNYYEIIQNNCNKGQAIKRLCEYLNIPTKNAVAFGDGRNDIDMFKAVGTAIGVGGGSKEILEYVHSTCESVMMDGIYLELKRRNII